MTQVVRFTKMHGAGNDYIYVDTSLYTVPDPSAAAIAWSDRHTGIGSDGLVLIGRASVPEADYSMRIFNADGSEAMMCGNASRCIGKYLHDRGLTDRTEIRLLTLSGVKTLRLHLDGAGVTERVTVDMGTPVLSCPAQIATADGTMTDGSVEVYGRTVNGTFVSMGNPHFVIFTDDIGAVDVERLGAALKRIRCSPNAVTLSLRRCLTTAASAPGYGNVAAASPWPAVREPVRRL